MTQADVTGDFSSWLDEQEKAAHQVIEQTHGEARALLYGEPRPAKAPEAPAPDETPAAADAPAPPAAKAEPATTVATAAKTAKAEPATKPRFAPAADEGRHRGPATAETSAVAETSAATDSEPGSADTADTADAEATMRPEHRATG